MSVDSIIDDVIRREGGYVNHASDRGGPTNWGITARALGDWRGLGRVASAEEVNGLTVAEARTIYMDRYVYRPGFDTLAALSERVGDEVIDDAQHLRLVGEAAERALVDVAERFQPGAVRH